MVESNPKVWIAALRGSHDRLGGLIGKLGAEQFRAQSYDKDWTVAQVLSHLGSGAEIGQLMLAAALGRGGTPGRDDMTPIWDRWNTKAPDEQVADSLAVNEDLVRAYEALSGAELAAMRYTFLGMELDAAGLVRMRLSEHAVHTWDVEVTFDPVAPVAAEAVALLIDNVAAFVAPRLGKARPDSFAARITTTAPDRDYLLTSADKVTMADWRAADAVAPDAELSMPAEALIRLAMGRLDPDHTPSEVHADPAALERLRVTFPGF